MSVHDHTTDLKSKNILFAVILNVGFTIFEIIGGLLTNSVAILSDALHDLGDSISLIASYFAEREVEKRPTDAKRTFGYARLSLFSGVLNAVVLIVGSVFILYEAVQRLFTPESVHATGMIFIAIVGVVVNGIGFARLQTGKSANERILSWHLLEDVVGWVAVLIGAIIIYFTDFYLIDPILTIGYTIFILWGVWGSLREVGNLLMEGVPKDINIDTLIDDLTALPHVEKVYHVHVWSLDGATNLFTGHVVTSALPESWKDIRETVKKALQEKNIEHATIEIESE